MSSSAEDIHSSSVKDEDATSAESTRAALPLETSAAAGRAVAACTPTPSRHEMPPAAF
jgi:hypothetical protein